MNRKEKMISKDKGSEGMSSKVSFDTKTLKRLFSYMRDYKGQLVFVAVCILLSAAASAASSLFLQSLIDDYITPLLGAYNPVFSELLKALVLIGAVYLAGVISTLLYSRVMVTIAQGTLKKIRDEMFEKMQRLPIRAFDTRTHGDIMSLYTNDTEHAPADDRSINGSAYIFGIYYCGGSNLYALRQRMADACCGCCYVLDFTNCKNGNG